MTARGLLATPPATVLGFYAVAIGIPMLLEAALPTAIPAPVSALLDWAFWICAVVWAFALYTVAHSASHLGSRVIGNAIFGVTSALIVVSMLIQSWLGPPERWVHDPIDPLIAVFFCTLLCAAISLGFAASALDRFEGGSGLPIKDSPMWWTCFAMLFLPIGIWFLRGRVQKLLARGD
ncbi:MAG: hypothetical protein NW206_02880 [Hyphomonadaceae bacterium]|nr:hypothetical protein [Hyphomonadaceae bacterium]